MDRVERLILLAFTKKKLRALRKGFRDIKAGRTTPIKDIHNFVGEPAVTPILSQERSEKHVYLCPRSLIIGVRH